MEQWDTNHRRVPITRLYNPASDTINHINRSDMDRLCQWQTYRKPGRRNRWTRTDQAQDLHKEIREQHYCNSSSDKCGTMMCWNSDRSHRWKHEYHTQPRPPQPPLIASFKNWKGYSKLVRALKRWKQTSARHEPELNTPGSSRQA